MKKLLLLPLVALFLSGCLAQTSTYTDESISFQYPSNFEIVDNTGLALSSHRDLEFFLRDAEGEGLISIGLTLKYPVTFPVDEYGDNLAQMIQYYTTIPYGFMEPVDIYNTQGILYTSGGESARGNDLKLFLPIPEDTPWIHETNDIIEIKFSADFPSSNYENALKFFEEVQSSFKYVSEPVEYDVNARTSMGPDNFGKFQDGGFKGSYFFVEPPEDFELADSTHDYAAFKSPDEKVIFAVYSPLWHGEGEEIFLQEGEVEVSREVEETFIDMSEIGSDTTQTDTYVTVEAKDDSYTRSIVEIFYRNEGGGTQRIFSYQYKDQESYDEYLDQYLKFKKSLIQYAD